MDNINAFPNLPFTLFEKLIIFFPLIYLKV